MDIAALTTFAMTALMTFFGHAFEGAAAKVCEVTVEQSKHVFEKIKERFSKEYDDGKASQALQTLVSDPDNQGTVEIKLKRILQADPDFAQALQHIYQAGSQISLTVGEEAQARRIVQHDSTRAAKMGIDIKQQGVAEDIIQRAE
jgi:hypothetical protein